MTRYKYLIVGAGMAADAAVKGIRELDKDGTIALIGAEANPPYNRPPLTKDLWKGKPMEKIWRKTEEKDAELFLGRTVKEIDTQKKQVVDDSGAAYEYEKLLLATGGTPRRLPFGGDRIIYFRTVEDYRHLRELANEKERFGVIGGGFIGSELAAALAMNGKQVTMVFPEEGIGAKVFPQDLSQYINDYFKEKGVELLAGQNVKDVREQDGSPLLVTDQGEIPVGGVVAGIGIQPNIELARAAGLQVEEGILVNENAANHPAGYLCGRGRRRVPKPGAGEAHTGGA